MINKNLGANGLPHFSVKALDLIILCANHHDYEVNIETFKFNYIVTKLCAINQ